MLLLTGLTGPGCAIVFAGPELLRPSGILHYWALPTFLPCSLQDKATLSVV